MWASSLHKQTDILMSELAFTATPGAALGLRGDENGAALEWIRFQASLGLESGSDLWIN